MRKVSDKTNGVGNEDTRLGLRLQRPNGRIESSEKLIGDKNVARRERSHERRLTGIGVTNDSNFGQTFPVSTTLDLFCVNGIEFSLKFANTIAHLSALQFVKGFAYASGASSAASSFFGADNALTRREIFETCEFHLKLRLPGSRMPVKNFEDDRRPIVNMYACCFSDVANLCRREFVIENDAVDFRELVHERAQFFKLPRPYE